MNRLTKFRIQLLQKRYIRLMDRASHLFEKAESLDPETKKANETATEEAWRRFEKRMIDEGIFE